MSCLLSSLAQGDSPFCMLPFQCSPKAICSFGSGPSLSLTFLDPLHSQCVYLEMINSFNLVFIASFFLHPQCVKYHTEYLTGVIPSQDTLHNYSNFIGKQTRFGEMKWFAQEHKDHILKYFCLPFFCIASDIWTWQCSK